MSEITDAGRIACKEQILEAVDNKMLEISSSEDAPEKAEYRKILSQELEHFRKSVEERIIYNLADAEWRYAVIVRGSGIYLILEHVLPKELGIREEEKTDEQYEMISCKAKLLDVETYAGIHNISHVAAVTRIRRGKIRSAVKVGKQWRIPALAEPVERGYRSAVYGWHNRLSGLPDMYKIIEDYQRVEFFQDEKTLCFYHVKMTGDGIEPLEFVCKREKRARLEQMLIGHPDVVCLSDEIMRIDKV